MTTSGTAPTVALVLLLATGLGAGGVAAHSGPHEPAMEDTGGGAVLGRLEFPTSARVPAAQAAFVEGMLWLHLFEYERAAELFRRAQDLETGFAMAYWGEAMTHNHPLWDQQERESARAVLARLGPTPEARAVRAGSDRERAFLAALDILYGEGPKAARDRAYLRHMAGMTRRWPDDHEVSLFHALAHFGIHAGIRHVPDYLRAAAIAQDVFAANPGHPGAAHYLIHGVDDPLHAVLGLSAARALARMAPDAPHAQHMASHIFLELGMWEALIEANRAAVAVGKRIRADRGLPPRHTGHYNFWLLYGLLQTGRHDQARALLDAARAERRRASDPPPAPLELDPDTSLTGSLVQMWARYLIETRSWDDELFGWRFELGESTDPKLTEAFVRSLAGYRRGDREAGERWRRRFESARASLVARVESEAGKVPQHLMYLDRLVVLDLQLAAAAAIAVRNKDSGLALAAEASNRENAMPTVFGPPFIDYPAAVFHADLLREAGRHRDAVAAYHLQLERSPGRIHSLRGLLAAAEAAGDAETAAWARQALRGHGDG